MPKLTGIIPPIVTPLIKHDQLDLPAVDRVCQHIMDGGVNGLFVLGTTGEGPSLTYQIRYELVERVCESVRGKVPVLVGITDSSLAESLHLAQHAAGCGATAVVAAAPFYYPVGQAELVNWFLQLADESNLPVLLYNMPGCVGVNLDLATVAALSRHPNVIGIKDSSGDLVYFDALCQQFADNDDFCVFMGPEELIPDAVKLGADGGVCGGANLLPGVYVDLFNAAKQGDEKTVRTLLHVIEKVFCFIYRDPASQMNLIPALKLAMSFCGLCSSVTAPPLPKVSSDRAVQVQNKLAHLLQVAGSKMNVSSASTA